ncbi:MAG: hypothetical protein IKT68_01075 [Clostridia bacterium]|nr:hypothetical protein [Clostridia bacterium]
MGIFDETMSAARSWLDSAGRKTEHQVEIQKIRLAIMKKQEELSRQYETLGKLYHRWQNEGDAPKGLAVLCEDIEANKQAMEHLRVRLEQKKNEIPF